jgi:V/A-type H+/Na+-transporting ATPase subunit B
MTIERGRPVRPEQSGETGGRFLGHEVVGIARIEGPIVLVDGVRGASYDEVVDVIDAEGRERRGRVLEVGLDMAIIEVFSGTTGLSLANTRVRFRGRPMSIPVAEEMLGRVFDGLGNPIDGEPEPLPEDWADINGHPINPVARQYPQGAILTGISAIDGMNTLILGQKLPIFSGSGLPHDQIAAQIVRQATLVRGEGDAAPIEDFAIIFVALGVKHDVAEFFRDAFASTGALARVAMFLNLADDPAIERIVTPRVALTLAEFLAFRRDMHVLVVLTDMTNYCEALRQVSSARGEIPSRKGYPGYLYSDLASLYERSGRLRGSGAEVYSRGSITQIPILTMPNDDITHPVPDLTGYITEGQVVLARELFQQGIYPPVNVPPSLSRLMDNSIGKGHTRPDHPHVASQLYAAYARAAEVRSLASVVGEEGLSAVDQAYLRFGDVFEQQFIRQGRQEARSMEQTLELGWQVLSVLPKSELTRVRDEEIEAYYRKNWPAAGAPPASSVRSWIGGGR